MLKNPMPQNRATYLREMLEKAIKITNEKNPDKPPLTMPKMWQKDQQTKD